VRAPSCATSRYQQNAEVVEQMIGVSTNSAKGQA
jgi:hypothetical protein